MDLPDARGTGQLVQRLGLVDEHAVREVLDDMGTTVPGETFLRALERKGHLTAWQSSKILKGDREGFLLGGYRLLYKIQSGSFGRVFRGDDTQTGRTVAIKVLRSRWAENKAIIDLFLREGKVGLSLKHPNIVEVLAVAQDQASGQYYIVMEFVEGGNLREILSIRKTFSPPDALGILEDAASGLAYAFSQGVTHRDVKLSNLLMASSGMAKLVDFGLAQVVTARGGSERDKVDRTVEYAGLEKATNVTPGDTRSDIFFLGCIFYELLTGRPPLPAAFDRRARQEKRRFREIEPIKRDELEAPPSVFSLVETMLTLEPTKRFQTPSQLLEVVKTARNDLVKKPDGKKAARSVFVAESDERLQDALREKFKEMGYRVFIAGDPLRALDRFRQQPYDALVIDAGTTGEDGLLVFERVLLEAKGKQVACCGILILSEEQADWARRVPEMPNAAVMVRPVGLKQLHRKLIELMPDA